MPTPQQQSAQIGAEQERRIEAIVERYLRSKSGVVAGTYENATVTADDTGRILALAAGTGGGASLIAIYDMTTSSSTTATRSVGAGGDVFYTLDYNRKIYDPNSLVTTGSGWKLTATSAGYYEVTASQSNVSPITWDNDAYISLYLKRKNSGGSVLGTLELDRDVDVNAPTNDERLLNGTRTIYLAATDYLYVEFEVYSTAGLTFRQRRDTTVRVEVKYWPGSAPVAGT